MKATKALPTEERVRRMNDQQWLWYYLNLVEDENEDEKKTKTRLDYLGWWINPKLAQSVMEEEKVRQRKNQNKQSGIRQIGGYEYEDPNNSDGVIHYEDDAFNTGFEEELKRALQESGSEEEFVELPDSTSAGNPYESADDFIARVSAIGQQFKNEQSIIQSEEQFIEQGDPNSPEFIETLKKAGIDPNDVDYFDVE